jgi:hypothetical protein
MMRKIRTPALTAVSSALLFFCVTALSQQPAQKSVRVPDSTPVPLAVMDSLSSSTNEVDDPVHFEVTEDVKVGEAIAIPKGSTATGHVVESEGRKRMGRAGKLNFTVDYVKAPDGSNVRLRATSMRKGKDETGTVIIGTVLLSPLFLIRRGHDVNIAKGTKINAYVDGDREIVLGIPTPPAGGVASATAQPPQSQRAFGKTDVLDLLKGEVPSSRVIELVKERGIKFDPTEDDYKEIRAAGGDENLVNVLKAAALLRQ